MNEITDLTAKSRHFANETRADVRGVRRRHHENGLEAGREMAIHERHLILVFEITHRSQSANDDLRIHFPREIHEQTHELSHLDALMVVERCTNQLDALLDREQRLLR